MSEAAAPVSAFSDFGRVARLSFQAALSRTDRIQEESPMAIQTLIVNGKKRKVKASPDTPLLYVLRDEMGLGGAKFGCGLAQCGACTVIVEGRAVRSCVLPVGSVRAAVRTIEGIGSPKKPHPVQKAFIEEQAMACGYCANGWVMSTVAMLEGIPKPSEAQIREQLGDLKCRCGTHMAILRAVRKAAGALA
jgi:nicotinate dehydrogenase subunit A